MTNIHSPFPNQDLSAQRLRQMSATQLRQELLKRSLSDEGSKEALIVRLEESLSEAAVQCYSMAKSVTGCLIWNIEWSAIECKMASGSNNNKKGPGNSIRSLTVDVGGYEWYAELFPKGENNGSNSDPEKKRLKIKKDTYTHTQKKKKGNESWPSLFVSIVDTDCEIQMRFSVQTRSKGKWADPVISSLRTFRHKNHGWGWKEWMELDSLKALYSEDEESVLKLRLTIEVFGPVETVDSWALSDNIPSELSPTLKKLFLSGENSDVTIATSGFTIYEGPNSESKGSLEYCETQSILGLDCEEPEFLFFFFKK
ncbi:hypothetical protein RFI_07588 [Reticulomyxa filosa]|uniref:SAP domain-containing protein n=1 Tax=Reticulomyxa filosa TaxID=46433 RepID=X6NW82_RETFI|nr:hypothetical protein RFI_07588 [Reticulomyxa filosa]|eukprot:ETO29532.1 hypothetical protein RFI_07588 [Reticulomyxa filosa]